jgi:hypothetical protein
VQFTGQPGALGQLGVLAGAGQQVRGVDRGGGLVGHGLQELQRGRAGALARLVEGVQHPDRPAAHHQWDRGEGVPTGRTHDRVQRLPRRVGEHGGLAVLDDDRPARRVGLDEHQPGTPSPALLQPLGEVVGPGEPGLAEHLHGAALHPQYLHRGDVLGLHHLVGHDVQGDGQRRGVGHAGGGPGDRGQSALPAPGLLGRLQQAAAAGPAREAPTGRGQRPGRRLRRSSFRHADPLVQRLAPPGRTGAPKIVPSLVTTRAASQGPDGYRLGGRGSDRDE